MVVFPGRFSGLLDNQKGNLIKMIFVLSFLIDENKNFKAAVSDTKRDK
jgi:hypothetical protein